MWCLLFLTVIPATLCAVNDDRYNLVNNKPLPFPLKPVCFRHLGCFSMSPPWVTLPRPLPVPVLPTVMAIRVWFYRRGDPKQYEIATYPQIYTSMLPFDKDKMTFFITHGFEDTATNPWVTKMRQVILNTTDANVFVGQWEQGAKVLDIIQGAADTRMAAREFSNLFQYMIDQNGLNVTRLHLIGHSLGAQVCGLIGKSIPGVFQITALDPAQPQYSVADESVRLTKTDATFVVAMHSDARIFLPDLGFGFMNEVGHVDFYINGGRGQPSCQYPQVLPVRNITNIFDFSVPIHQIFVEVLLCPHQSAVNIFTEAIQGRQCIFWGQAITMRNLLSGISNIEHGGFFSSYMSAQYTPCEKDYDSCSPAGLDTYFWPARGTFILFTRGNEPYCVYEKAVTTIDDQRNFAVQMHLFLVTILNSQKLKTPKHHMSLFGRAGKNATST